MHMGVAVGPTEPSRTALPGSPEPAIEAAGLVKAYRGTVALDSVDLRVERGTVLGLLGPNGAGKTTLIRLLSTILLPDAGWFAVAGVSGTQPALIRRLIGVLPESAGYPQALTVEEWLRFHARLFGASASAARETSQRLLGEVGLTDRRGSLISRLSRGMRQRLGIARALVNDPQVMFLDEPTLGLDPMGQRQILQLVTGVARQRGVTVVMSTHVLADVEDVCDRVVILNRGRVVAEGTVADVIRRVAAPRRAVVRVPPPLRARALDVLASQRLPAAATTVSDGGELELELPAGEAPEHSSTDVLRALLEAEVPVLGLSLDGGRLSDAFLAVTEGERR